MKEKLRQWLRSLRGKTGAAPTQTDEAGVNVEVTHFRLTKYEGDPPQPGEEKEPIEIIQGGDNLPTRVWRRINGKMVEVTHDQS